MAAAWPPVMKLIAGSCQLTVIILETNVEIVAESGQYNLKLPPAVQRSSPFRHFGPIWNRLTAPVVPIANYDDRLKSQWLASLILLLTPVAVVVGILSYAFKPLSPAWWRDPNVLLQLLILTSLVPVQFMSRYGHYRTVARLCIAVAMISICTIVILDQNVAVKLLDATWLLVPVLFASILFDRRTTFLVIAVSFMVLLSMPLLWISLSTQLFRMRMRPKCARKSSRA